jgi:hypothetical protein
MKFNELEDNIIINNRKICCRYNEQKEEIIIFDGIKHIDFIKELYYKREPLKIYILKTDIERKIIINDFNFVKHRIEGYNFYIYVNFRTLSDIKLSFNDLPAKH